MAGALFNEYALKIDHTWWIGDPQSALLTQPEFTRMLITVAPNSRLKWALEPGDPLLGFGKLESMRNVLPAKTHKKRRPLILRLNSTSRLNTVSQQINLP
jgi:hypothetical protein